MDSNRSGIDGPFCRVRQLDRRVDRHPAVGDGARGSLRDDCLNLETFHNRDHARALIKLYGRDYNERRPHSGLGYLTPREFAEKWKAKQRVGTFPARAM